MKQPSQETAERVAKAICLTFPNKDRDAWGASECDVPGSCELCVAEAVAALAAMEEPADQWQDISTAPLGGTVLTQHQDDLYPVPAYQLTRGEWQRETEGPEDCFYGAERHCPLHRTPTHWRPLPPPPRTPNTETDQQARYGDTAIRMGVRNDYRRGRRERPKGTQGLPRDSEGRTMTDDLITRFMEWIVGPCHHEECFDGIPVCKICGSNVDASPPSKVD